MSPATQAKLLRVLQDQEFQRLGGTRVLRTDARLVSATNQDLAVRMREGSFREDLFFRLNVIRIHLPPLRERPDDLLALAHHFLQRFAREVGRPVRGFTDEALARIRSHSWPGNVRELHNTLERGVLMAEGAAHRRRRPGAAVARRRRRCEATGVRSFRPAGCACARSSASSCSRRCAAATSSRRTRRSCWASAAASSTT